MTKDNALFMHSDFFRSIYTLLKFLLNVAFIFITRKNDYQQL